MPQQPVHAQLPGYGRGRALENRAVGGGKSKIELCGVVGGKMVIEMLAGKMRLVRGGIAAMGNEHYCGNLLW